MSYRVVLKLRVLFCSKLMRSIVCFGVKIGSYSGVNNLTLLQTLEMVGTDDKIKFRKRMK